MKSSAPPRMRASVLTAAFLSLVLASQAMAAVWSQPIPLTMTGKAQAGGLVTLGTSHIIAAYLNKGRVVARRSTDSGATWLSPQRLAISASTQTENRPAISGRGTSVDIVWVKNDRVRYARSTNSGASFRATAALSPKDRLVMSPKVARGANGLVVVAWMQVKRVPCCDGPWNIQARVSTNGGASFGPARLLDQGRPGDGRQLAAAAGNGVAYVAFGGWRDIIVPGGMVSETGMHIRRTFDGGASWASSTFFAWPDESMYAPGLSMTAAGKQAYVAYEAYAEYCDNGDDNCTNDSWIQYRRTTNKGASWSAARNITKPTYPGARDPVISLKGGVARVAFTNFVELSPDDYSRELYYSQSSNGLSWTQPEQVSPDGLPAGVGHATRIIVLYSDAWDYSYSSGFSNVLVRTGRP